MSVFVKICGVRDKETARTAADAGADAIGLVLAESPRHVDIATAADIVSVLPWHMRLIAVMRSPTDVDIGCLMQAFNPDWLQMDADAIDDQYDGQHWSARVLPVFRNRVPAGQPPVVLFESDRSGAGVQADWTLARRVARTTRVILAGGLDPENVAIAIQTVNPWGVDVSSGVEHAIGCKDPDLIYQFVRAAKNAAHAPESPGITRNHAGSLRRTLNE